MQHHDPVGTPRGEEEEASGDLKSRLGAAENVLATVAVDLDSELQFASGLRPLTALAQQGAARAFGAHAAHPAGDA
jgi:ATP-binding cassette, subfamily B, bacterial